MLSVFLQLIFIIHLTKGRCVLIFSELSHKEVVNSVFGESEERGSEERTGVEGEVKVCGGKGREKE